MQLEIEFCTIDELCTDSRFSQMEKYVPNLCELESIERFAEKYSEPGIVKIFCNNKPYIVCSKTYNYYDGSEPEIYIIFNAEVMLGDDAKFANAPVDFYIPLHLELHSAIVRVPIRQAYFHHIFWHEELEEIFSILDEIKEAIEELEEDDNEFYIDC